MQHVARGVAPTYVGRPLDVTVPPAVPDPSRGLLVLIAVVLAGVGIGLIAAIFSAKSLESLLYEVEARDPLVFAVVSIALLGVALLASYVPARRASAVNPVEAIRTD